MASRKSSLLSSLAGSSSISNNARLPPPSAAAGNKSAAAVSKVTMSSTYLDALKVLSEETMNKACELLLSDRDYQIVPATSSVGDEEVQIPAISVGASATTPAKTDLEQLQDLYRKCRRAAKVVEKEHAALTMSSVASSTATAPPTLPSIPAPRSSSIAARMTGAGQSFMGTHGSVTISNGVYSNRRTSSSLHHNHHHHHHGKRSSIALGADHHQQPQHHNSQTHAAEHKDEQHNKNLVPVLKKQRSTSPTPSGAIGSSSTCSSHGGGKTSTSNSAAATTTSSSGSITLPPPSARQFLAKLNSDKGTTLIHPNKSKSDSSVSARKNLENANMEQEEENGNDPTGATLSGTPSSSTPSSSNSTRIQPPRASHK